MLSGHYRLFKHSDTKWDKNITDQNWEGGGGGCISLLIRHCNTRCVLQWQMLDIKVYEYHIHETCVLFITLLWYLHQKNVNVNIRGGPKRMRPPKIGSTVIFFIAHFVSECL